MRRNKAIQGIYGEFERHYANREYVHWRWQISRERQAVEDSISQRRLNGEYISYGMKQSLLFIAEQKYIENHSEKLFL